MRIGGLFTQAINFDDNESAENCYFLISAVKGNVHLSLCRVTDGGQEFDLKTEDAEELLAALQGAVECAKTAKRDIPKKRKVSRPKAKRKDGSLNIWTDVARFCIFDPVVFEGTRQPKASPHWRNPDVRDGRFAVIGLIGDGEFRLRLTDGGLTERELQLVNDTVGPFGVEVRSGSVYASGMDLPGQSRAEYAKHGAGGFVKMSSGAYNVLIYELDLRDVAESEKSEFSDYVAVFRPRSEPFVALTAKPRFSGGLALKKLLKERRAKRRST